MPAELDAVLAPSLRRFDEAVESDSHMADGSDVWQGHHASGDASAEEFRERHQSGDNPESGARDTIETLQALSATVSQLASRSGQNPIERRAEIEALLQGIPLRAAVAALHDWHSDLLGVATDPDPGTDAEVSLDRRLFRQLRAAGTAIEDLPRPVRDRLLEAVSE